MRLELHPAVVDDIRALPDAAAQRAAIQVIADIRAGRRSGAELDFRVATGDLRDCRKIYFDAPGTGDKPRFRLVYRVLDQGQVEVLSAEVIAVGRRVNLAAYVTAAQRLGRLHR